MWCCRRGDGQRGGRHGEVLDVVVKVCVVGVVVVDMAWSTRRGRRLRGIVDGGQRRGGRCGVGRGRLWCGCARRGVVLVASSSSWRGRRGVDGGMWHRGHHGVDVEVVWASSSSWRWLGVAGVEVVVEVAWWGSLSLSHAGRHRR